MRIKMNNMKFRISPGDSSHSSQCHQMLSPQEQRHFSLLQDFLCTILYVSKRLFTAAEAKLQISTVKYLDIHKVTILIRAVGFQSKAFMTNGRRTEPGSRTKACGRIKGSSVKNNFCFLKTAVTTDKIFNIW